MSLFKPDEFDVCAAIPHGADRKKLSKRALEILESIECQLDVCSTLPSKTNARAILCLLAGSLALDPSLHTSFAKAGFVASRPVVSGRNRK